MNRAAGEADIAFRSADYTSLRGTLRVRARPRAGVLLVHGLTGDRSENGLYDGLAARLDEIGAASLRFDLRGHGKSGGSYEGVAMSGIMADIATAHRVLASRVPRMAPTFVVAASFAGGLSVCWAEADAACRKDGEDPRSGRNLAPPAGLVLLNPLFDYPRRLLHGKPWWSAARMGLTEEGMDALVERGWLDHHGFRIGPAMLNELPCIRPQDRVVGLPMPLLTVHGDADETAPHDISRRCTARARRSEFATIEGADHGFVRRGDDGGGGGHADTRRFRAAVLDKVASWISAGIPPPPF